MKPSAQEVLKRSYKILGLALLFFLITVGLLGRWWWQSSHEGAFGKVKMTAGGYAPGVISSDKPLVLDQNPQWDSFQQISWPLKQDLIVTGECRDQYYTIVIYPTARDYRQDPTSNVFNRAYVCTKGEPWQQTLSSNSQLPTSNFQLATGTYYLIRADQGAEGSWYNPY